MIDKDLFKLLGKDKKYLIYAVIFMVIGLISNLVFIFCISLVINIVINKLDYINFIYILLIALGAIIIRYFAYIIAAAFKNRLGKNVKIRLRELVYLKATRLGNFPLTIAEITQASSEGIEQLDLYYTSYLPQFFYACIAPFILFLTTVFLDYRSSLTLIALVPLIPISIIMVSVYAKKIFNKYWDKYTKMGDSFLDSLEGLNELRMFGYDERKNDELNLENEEFRKITMKVLVMQLASTTIMDTVAYGGAGLGISVALLGAINGWITGAFGLSTVAIVLFIILSSIEYFLPMRKFGSAFHIGMNGATSGRKLLKLLEFEEKTWGNNITKLKEIKVSGVDFSYDNSKRVLNNVNLEFKKGLSTIVGKSGSGKSTIVKLLLGYITPNKGSILVDDKELYSLDKIWYYDNIALVSYNTYLFNESIRDNFILAKANITDEEIYEALRQVNLYDFVVNNGGLDMVILENSKNISGGERQRLALAINLVKDKAIYIFDEATSNIDIESEAIIVKHIKNLSKNKIVIMITHRLENAHDSDVIYYMEDGNLKEYGNHNSLINLNGGYKELYEIQKSLENGYKEASYE